MRMFAPYFDRKLTVGFFLTLTIIISLSVYAYLSTQRLIQTARLLSHANQVISLSQQILSKTIDMETASRGYVITHDTEYLRPHYQAIDTIDTILNNLNVLVRNSPTQMEQVEQLIILTNRKINWVNQVVNARSENFESSRKLIQSNKGKMTMDTIREVISKIQQQERLQFTSRNTIGRAQLQEFQIAFLGLLIITAIIIISLFYLIYKNLKAQNLVEYKLKAALEEISDLYENAPCGYHSLDANGKIVAINQTELNWLGYKREEVLGELSITDILTPESQPKFNESRESHLHDTLNQDVEYDFVKKDGSLLNVVISTSNKFDSTGIFIKSRTSVSDNTERKKTQNNMIQLHKELEAFTYSVSHDLRAPLRSIDGYARILEEDYGMLLDSTGIKTINTITRNAIRMGQLIDDLLDFSRTGRADLKMATVDMDQIVQSIIEDQIKKENGRKINLTIGHLGSANADLSMIKQVWINLLSNAFKYSQRNDVTEISITRMDTEGEVRFSVRDNGAGFDMQYVHKLFEVFQRLHGNHEFEGTGVGLALVKRIVNRHGGSVWAEAKVNEGATFYFSLIH